MESLVAERSLFNHRQTRGEEVLRGRCRRSRRSRRSGRSYHILYIKPNELEVFLYFFTRRNYRIKTSDLSLELIHDPAPRRHGDSRTYSGDEKSACRMILRLQDSFNFFGFLWGLFQSSISVSFLFPCSSLPLLCPLLMCFLVLSSAFSSSALSLLCVLQPFLYLFQVSLFPCMESIQDFFSLRSKRSAARWKAPVKGFPKPASKVCLTHRRTRDNTKP